MSYIIEFIFFLAIISIADLQARMIGSGKIIHHGWWDVLFGVLIAAAWWQEERNWWLLSALITEHFIFFPVALNFLRTPRKAFFYLSSEPHKGSIWDWLLLKIQPAYPFIWGVGVAAFIFFQFKL